MPGLGALSPKSCSTLLRAKPNDFIQQNRFKVFLPNIPLWVLYHLNQAMLFKRSAHHSPLQVQQGTGTSTGTSQDQHSSKTPYQCIILKPDSPLCSP